MGQMPQRCSCLFHKDDTSTAKLEPSEDNNHIENININVNEVIPIDSHQLSSEFKNMMLKSKSMHKSNPMCRDFLSDDGNDDQKSPTFKQPGNLSQRKFTMSDKNLTLNFKKLKNEQQPSKAVTVITLQRMLRGAFYRKKFKTIKVRLSNQMNQMIKDFSNKINPNVKKAESLMPRKYDKHAWKNLPPEELKKCQFDYGRLYQTKLKIVPDVCNYSGSVNINNEMHGYGICFYNNGSRYEGYWRNNNFTGWGRLIDAEGVIWEGTFENGLLTGKGTKRQLSEGIYEGEFLNSMKHGTGHEETKEHKYVGQYKLDKKEGKGRLEYKILKDIYEGEFKDSQITGFGLYTWANRDTYEGVFLNGKMHGKGKYKWPDGGEYFGDYVNNIKEGNGIFKWSNGKAYEGPFKNGRPNGIGKVKHNEKEIEVEFKDGKLAGNSNSNQTPNESGIVKKDFPKVDEKLF